MFTTQKAQLRAENKTLLARIAELEHQLEEKNQQMRIQAASLEDDLIPLQATTESESSESVWSIFDRAIIGIAKIDRRNHDLVRCNPAFKAMLGYSEEEIVQLNMIGITHPGDLSGSLEQLARLSDNSIASFVMEKRYLKKNGDVIWARTTVTRFESPENEKGYSLVFIEDISKAKQAENALRESEERFDLAVKGSNDGLWDWTGKPYQS